MMTVQERILAQLKYKIEEHSRAADDHLLQAATYREVKDLVERTFDIEERRNEPRNN